MALSIADYLLQLPENMNFAKVQELSGRGFTLLSYAFRLRKRLISVDTL